MYTSYNLLGGTYLIVHMRQPFNQLSVDAGMRN
jgi:hypothetical protein